MSKPDCKTCPLNKDYKFSTQCRLTTCKFFSPVTKNKCLGMDIKFSADDKGVADLELLRYKFPDKEMSVRDVTRIRKRAVEKVKSTLALYHVVQVLRSKYSEKDGMLYTPGEIHAIDIVLSRKPLSITVINFEPWMLKFIFDEEITFSILGTKLKLKECLGLKTKAISTLSRAVSYVCSGN